MDVHLRELRYFVAVAEELNFSRAAARLNMSQPPLSAAVRQLEQSLGTELLVRSTREVRLTDAGVTFLAGARQTLAEMEHTLRATRRAAAGAGSSVRIGFSRVTRFETLPAIGRRFRAAYPEIDLVTEEMWNARMADALQSGEIDVALAVVAEPAPGLVLEPIRSEPLRAFLPLTHPLALEDDVALADLAGDQFIRLPRELAPRVHETFVGVCRAAGFEPNMRNGGWELDALPDLGAVSIGPASAALELPPRVVALPLRDVDTRVETSLVFRADQQSVQVCALREVAAATFADADDLLAV
jgi:DNA-binding transcriptional LysR family regulator